MNVRLLCGDIEKLPVESGTVDLLLCIGVLQYVSSPAAAIEEIRRVTRQGATVVMCFENLWALSHLDWVARQKCNAMMSGQAPTDDGLSMTSEWFQSRAESPHRYRLYRTRKIDGLMESAGFQQADAMTYGYEFRVVRGLRLLPDAWIDGLELVLERFFHRFRIPCLSRSGEYYIGLYTKSGPDLNSTTPHKKMFDRSPNVLAACGSL
jgi:SAM-dependent methyltransferase